MRPQGLGGQDTFESLAELIQEQRAQIEAWRPVIEAAKAEVARLRSDAAETWPPRHDTQRGLLLSVADLERAKQ